MNAIPAVAAALSAALALPACTSDRTPPAAGPSTAASSAVTPSSPASSAVTPSSAAPLALPVVRESFTAGPCDRGGSTIEMANCHLRDVLAADADVNRLTATLWARRFDDEGRRKMVDAHEAWLRYREAACVAYADASRGGTLATVEFPACLARVTRHRADVLRAEVASSPESAG